MKTLYTDPAAALVASLQDMAGAYLPAAAILAALALAVAFASAIRRSGF